MTNKKKLNNAIKNLHAFKEKQHNMTSEEKKEELNNILSEIKSVVHDQKTFELFQEKIQNAYVLIT